ncbi:hypothetical protein PK69_10840 [Xanthomonas phaseoli pv. phaseoli]|uniref:Membrane protein n=1 Tax=Xanthomonas campestris pv. phaseoli TaxID=317013 RepID=A0AB34QMS2_XANCH|nr:MULTISPECIES: hypothetical protein [Xanthomonas]ATS23675.1 hypothetical protein XppCFBP412P_21575 [Xanthomonas phaseoli pv. phaseoli]ATS26566.1 hypothetical protein XppCFBP6164P_14450 [Xanthomonas phaseoli pv. phaseoli]ATS29955.1 hypothetical protein XppCFBP6546P_09170 [Xanthomonas phaseoli pv. phaseoli]ATS34829.1 hypothetical protein XppCFBP6982P_13965 [Xanthomonas phaseoli pv. phaseoli]AZU11628.1 hypothetical protein AC609_02540 [Xanthomonas phaseoli pv. phaseoli]
MNPSPLTLATMRAVLRQGAALDRFSLLLLAAAIGLLGVAQAPPLIQWSYAISVLAGVVQRYWAFRVGLDADLLAASIAHLERCGGSEQDAAHQLDAAMHAIGLVAKRAPTRDWASRWTGMRRLLCWQLASVVVQLLLVDAALALRMSR